MSTDIDDAAGTGTSTTASPTVGEGADGRASLPEPDYKALYEKAAAELEEFKVHDWKKRLAGAQGAYQSEKKRHEETQALLDATKQELEALQSRIAEIDTLNEQLEAARAEIEIKTASLDRLSIITKEFPDLLPFLGGQKDGAEEPDLLPDGTGDELRARLKAFSEKIGVVKGQSQQRSMEGASPRPPAPAGSPTSESYMQIAIEAMRKGDMETYEEYYAKALEAQS